MEHLLHYPRVTSKVKFICSANFRALLPPANEVCEGYVFTGVCHSVHRGGGGRAWLLWGGRAWLLGGVRGCSGGCAWLLPGGGCAWLLGGGGCGCSRGGHAWLLPGGGVCGFFDEIRSMSGRYASYWNAYLFIIK